MRSDDASWENGGKNEQHLLLSIMTTIMHSVVRRHANPQRCSDSSVLPGDRYRTAVPPNGIVNPDMPSPQDSRTVAALTVSSQKERLTPQCSGAKYALTTTPCTEALYTATGGPNAFYDALGFPWCNFMLDAKTYYAEAPLGFERSESTSYLPHPLNPPPIPPPSHPG